MAGDRSRRSVQNGVFPERCARMCGIAGIWNSAESPQDSAARVSSMLKRMRHRGPDGEGGFAFESGAAGMVRLSLVDLSDRGQQPLWSNDHKVAILFNGEIYNFREHRKRLELGGYCFRSTTDTEVILALYLEQGEGFLNHIRGMYAIALFDWRRSHPGGLPELLLARGPIGVKPLYIASTGPSGAGCIFASEIRAILASQLVAPTVSTDALRDYLSYGFVVQPRTIIQDVRMLEPGMVERYTPGKAVTRKKFWKLPAYQPIPETSEEAAERLRHVLKESIAIHAFADAKVGAFLSGGVDSNGIVGLMREHVPNLQTFTLRFPEFPDLDEADLARESAAHFECENTVVEIRGRDVRDFLPQFAGELDQPSTDGLNTWAISKAAARQVKGVLSGLGGDEWFAGYPCARRMLELVSSTRGRAFAGAGKVASWVDSCLPSVGVPGRIRQRLENLSARRSTMAIWLQAHTNLSTEQVRCLAGDSVSRDPFTPIRDAIEDPDCESPLDLCCQLDVAAYMRCQLLRDSDATSMAHSLELRVPFVDVELARFARSCSDAYKISGNPNQGSNGRSRAVKQVLLKALEGIIPDGIATRPKRGFSLPVQHWMANDLSDIAQDSYSMAMRRGLLDERGITMLLNSSRRDEDFLYPKAWSILILELWCQSVLDGAQTATAHGALSSFEFLSTQERHQPGPLGGPLGCERAASPG